MASKLVTIDEWLQTTFTETSRPCKKTVYRWIRRHPSMARKIGGRVYIVDTPETLEAVAVTNQQATINRIAAMM